MIGCVYCVTGTTTYHITTRSAEQPAMWHLSTSGPSIHRLPDQPRSSCLTHTRPAFLHTRAQCGLPQLCDAPHGMYRLGVVRRRASESPGKHVRRQQAGDDTVRQGWVTLGLAIAGRRCVVYFLCGQGWVTLGLEGRRGPIFLLFLRGPPQRTGVCTQ